MESWGGGVVLGRAVTCPRDHELGSYNCTPTWDRSPGTPPNSHTSGPPPVGGEALGGPWGPLATQKLLSANSCSSSQPLLTPFSPAEEEVAQTAVELGLSLEEMR